MASADDYLSSLRTVGIALIILGIIDIGLMIYCIACRISYSSSFNVFAVIAGILLIRGGLRTANIVALFSAFMLSSSLGAIFLLPVLMPFELMLAYLRVYPAHTGVGLLITVCYVVFLGWIYRRLTTPSVLAAIADRYPRWTSFWRRPRIGFVIGTLLAVILIASLGSMTHCATAVRAIAEAKRKTEEGYKFCVSSLAIQSCNGRTHVEAVVTAYNRDVIKKIPVEWHE